VKVTNAEKLILVMLADLHQKLDVKGDVDPEFVKAAIYSDNLWGLDWEYSGLFGEKDEDTPNVVMEVCDFLDMWGFLEDSWSKLSAPDKAQVKKDAAPFGESVTFVGFDGNNEGEHISAARFLTERLNRFDSFKGRANLNAHSHTLDIHRRMYKVFEKIRPTLSSKPMDAAQITEVLKERVHPSRR